MQTLATLNKHCAEMMGIMDANDAEMKKLQKIAKDIGEESKKHFRELSNANFGDITKKIKELEAYGNAASDLDLKQFEQGLLRILGGQENLLKYYEKHLDDAPESAQKAYKEYQKKIKSLHRSLKIAITKAKKAK